MNASNFADFRLAAASGRLSDDKMEQVRELLFGDYRRHHDARLAELEQRVRDFETVVHHRLDTLQTRLDQLSGDIGADKRAAFEELARSIADLGDRVRRIP